MDKILITMHNAMVTYSYVGKRLSDYASNSAYDRRAIVASAVVIISRIVYFNPSTHASQVTKASGAGWASK